MTDIAFKQIWRYPWKQNSRQEHFWIVKYYNSISKIVKLQGFFDGYWHVIHTMESNLINNGVYIK